MAPLSSRGSLEAPAPIGTARVGYKTVDLIGEFLIPQGRGGSVCVCVCVREREGVVHRISPLASQALYLQNYRAQWTDDAAATAGPRVALLWFSSEASLVPPPPSLVWLTISPSTNASLWKSPCNLESDEESSNLTSLYAWGVPVVKTTDRAISMARMAFAILRFCFGID
ncbi:hypothetical protein LX36DRAFT_664477 [Colletotrichum falcatum]|nr:hypothetical protein LX36DRAFT_664477 [Colletotrichum falcatum]